MLCRFIFLGIEKCWEKKSEEWTTIFRRICFVSQYRIILQVNSLMCPYIRVSEKFVLNKVMSRLSVETSHSHSAEKLRGGTLLCFRKCPFGNFYGTVFVSFYRKTSCGVFLCLSKIRGLKVFLHEDDFTIFSQGGGGAGVGVERLSWDYCTSQCTKTFVGETVRVSLISSIEKF